ncbi:hypothetical protein [Candidatus Nanohalococcus occultus]|uniref:Uncharacterized protein n=1 Tax=Candidatus Nanohalococcus occultus TaxID=2978047 RepID=A0ABY8CJE0_9ARCH|nr:hypothetical protein SVXNc_0427 [Candidatus Nanohaloarchaeota archaeon SVXNc]
MSTLGGYVGIDSEQLDLEQAHRDLSFSGIKSKLDGELLVLKEQKKSALKILYESQGYGPGRDI